MVQEFDEGGARQVASPPSTYWDQPTYFEPFFLTLSGVAPTLLVSRRPVRLWGWVFAGPVDAYQVDMYDGQNATAKQFATVMNLAGVPHVFTPPRPILCTGGLFLQQMAGSPKIMLLIEREPF